MRFIEQSIFGAPGGNCLAACLASVLDLELAEVPDFCPETVESGRYGTPPPDVDAQDWAIAGWLERRGYEVGTLYLPPYCHDEDAHSRVDASGLVIASAWSPRVAGASHAIVLLDGRLHWDPHPGRAAGIGPIWGFLFIERNGRRLGP